MRRYMDILFQFLTVMSGVRVALPRRGRYQRRFQMPKIHPPTCLIDFISNLPGWLIDGLIDVLVIGGCTFCFLLMWLALFC